MGVEPIVLQASLSANKKDLKVDIYFFPGCRKCDRNNSGKPFDVPRLYSGIFEGPSHQLSSRQGFAYNHRDRSIHIERASASQPSNACTQYSDEQQHMLSYIVTVLEHDIF